MNIKGKSLIYLFYKRANIKYPNSELSHSMSIIQTSIINKRNIVFISMDNWGYLGDSNPGELIKLRNDFTCITYGSYATLRDTVPKILEDLDMKITVDSREAHIIDNNNKFKKIRPCYVWIIE